MTRRLTAFLAVAALTGVSACQQAEPEQPAAPVEAQPMPAPPVPGVGYACESGATVEARYADSATAQLTYKGQTYDLRSAQAASGARYVGSGVEWWTVTRDGQETATLSRLSPNDQVGVAVLERCARPAATPSPLSAAQPDQAVTPAPGGVLPAAAPCKGPQLKLAAEDGDAGAGNRVRNFSLQNIGSQACSLTGYPGMTLLDGQGRPLTAIRADQSPGSYFRQGQAPTPVTLAPQAKAWFELAWSVVPNEAMGEKTCPSAATLRATAPGDTAVIPLAFAFQPCGGKIRVSPIRAEENPQAAT
jgi:membrane-bound inhibitor of C-type lysozyme